MFEILLRRKKRYLALLVGVLTPLCIILGSNRPATAAKDRKTTANARQRAEATALKAASKSATGPYMVSLEMKENVDFLLTSALLMQEALSDDIITTYPSE